MRTFFYFILLVFFEYKSAFNKILLFNFVKNSNENFFIKYAKFNYQNFFEKFHELAIKKYIFNNENFLKFSEDEKRFLYLKELSSKQTPYGHIKINPENNVIGFGLYKKENGEICICGEINMTIYNNKNYQNLNDYKNEIICTDNINIWINFFGINKNLKNEGLGKIFMNSIHNNYENFIFGCNAAKINPLNEDDKPSNFWKKIGYKVNYDPFRYYSSFGAGYRNSYIESLVFFNKKNENKILPFIPIEEIFIKV